jgi:hypothetical protein
MSPAIRLLKKIALHLQSFITNLNQSMNIIGVNLQIENRGNSMSQITCKITIKNKGLLDPN